MQEGSDEVSHIMENVALEQLKPGQPVVEFTKIHTAYSGEVARQPEVSRSSLEEEPSSREERERHREELKEQAEATKDKIRMLTGELKRREHLENRIDLYYKERIGLHLAVQTGAVETLKTQGASAFYSSLV